MLKAREIHVRRIRLDTIRPPAPTAGESARAARLADETLRRRYLNAHGALRDILGRFTDARLDFALLDKGKPFLLNVPELQFNLSHSKQMSLAGDLAC